MFHKLKNLFVKGTTEPFDENEVIQKFLDKMTVESIPSRLCEQLEFQFYQKFDFMKLYTPAETSGGLERFLPYAIFIIVLIDLLLRFKH